MIQLEEPRELRFESLMTQDDFYRDILDSLPDGVYFTDTERRITFWNQGAEKLTGYTRKEVLGKRCRDNILRHVDGKGRVLCTSTCPLAATMADCRKRECEVYFHHKEGHRVPVLVRTSPIIAGDGAVVGAVEVFSNTLSMALLTERLEAMQQMALVDTLTGLPNRRFLEMQLQTKLDELARHGIGFGVLFADVDHFKMINDRHGHEAGDKVLKMVARTLVGSSRQSDVVGRWGGEEFLGIVGHTQQPMIAEIGERFRALVQESSIESPVRLQVTLSIGCASARADDTAESIVARADRMLYRAKREGRNRVCV
jgi:diguanylate cyclase (GGDEF)-like protein/PAS domain S-box-containing protein